MAYNPAFKRRIVPPEGKRIQYRHNKTAFERDGIKVTIKEDGKIDLEKETDDGTDMLEDVPASFIFYLAKILNASKKISFVDKEKK